MAYKTERDKEVAQLEPPQAVDAEQAVLGSILKDPEAISSVIEILDNEDHFYVNRHRLIFRASLSLYEKNDPCDITTVSEELSRMDLLDKIGGRLYLVELVEGLVSTANVSTYANIVLEKSVLRRLINVSNDVIKDCYSQEDEVSAILDNAEQNIFSISESRLRKGFIPLSALLPKTFEHIEEFEESKGGLQGIKTGYEQLDAMTAGLHNGDFVVIAGRPSMGKTAFALNIAEYVADQEKHRWGYFR